MTELLSPYDIGQLTLIVTGTSLFALFLINPVGMFFNRHLHDWIRLGVMRNHFNLYLLYIFFVCVTATIIILAYFKWRTTGLEINSGTIVFLVCGSLLLNTIVQTLIPSLNMIGRTNSFVVLTLGNLVVGLICSVLYVEYEGASAASWLTGAIVSQLIFSVISYKVVFNGVISSAVSKLNWSRIKKLVSFSLPISIAVGIQWAQGQGYKFLVATEFGLVELGLFVAGYGVAASLIGAAESVLTTWFQPQFYRDLSSEVKEVQERSWANYAGIMIPASVLAVTAVVAVGPSLPHVLLGPEFQGVQKYIILGAVAEWARFLVGLFGLNEHRNASTKSLIIPNMTGLVVTYISFLLMHKAFGMDALLFALVIGNVATVFYFYRSGLRKNKLYGLKLKKNLPNVTVQVVLALTSVYCQEIFVQTNGMLPSLSICGLVGAIWVFLTWQTVRQNSMMRHRAT